MVQEVIYNISVKDFRISWARYLGNRAQDPTTMSEADTMKTAFMIWAREGFSFTHLKVIYPRGSAESGYVLIPLPVNKVNFKKHFKEIQAKKALEQNKL